MPRAGEWMDVASRDVAGEDQEAGACVKRCPAEREAGVVVQVWCPESAKFMAGASVRLTGTGDQQGTTAEDSGAVTFRAVEPGDYSLRVTLTGASARGHRVGRLEPFRLGPGERKTVVVAVTVFPKVTATLRTQPMPQVKATLSPSKPKGS